MESNELIIEAEKIATCLEQELRLLNPSSNNQCCVHRVPKRLRHLNQKVYTPQLVSLGPLHHGKNELKPMEECKLRYLMEFLNLSTATMADYVKNVKENESKLRNSYAETIQLSSEEFVKIMLVDAAFVVMILIKIFLKYKVGFIIDEGDLLFKKPNLINEVRYDMLLLENQIPFFILEDLFRLSNMRECLSNQIDLSDTPELRDKHAMVKLALNFFVKAHIKDHVSELVDSGNVEHLLGLLSGCYASPKWSCQAQMKKPKTVNAPSIKTLFKAGVKFKPGSNTNLFDINFHKRVLSIPVLKIEDSTELMLRNLHAYEQCCCTRQNFGDYFSVMVQLVKSPKDIMLLVENGIIENWWSSFDDITTLFHDLDRGNLVNIDEFCYTNLIAELNSYCSKPWPTWKAILKQDYFQNPWATFSVIAAVVLLLLTVVQTICSIIQVKQISY